MKRRKSILLLLLLVMAGNAFPQGYNFKSFTSGDGLAQSFIYTVVQDTHGYLWIGTGNGLSRFNGLKFENYTTNDSLADNFITCAISDGESLWFGHMNGRISYYNGNRFSGVNDHRINVSHITHFAKCGNNNIWASTYSDGFIELEKGKGIVKHYKFKDQVVVLTFGFLDDNELIVGTDSGLLFCRSDSSGEIKILRIISDIPGSRITGITKMRNKPGFYIATENAGIFKLSIEGRLFRVSKIKTEPDFDFTGIQDVQEDSKSDLWLCTFGNGLINLNYSTGGELESSVYFKNAVGFGAVNVKTVFEDREGIIWSGNYGEGLTQITPKTFSVEVPDKQKYGHEIFSIWLNRQFRWLGTENGLVKIDQHSGKIIKFYGEESGLPRDTVSAIFSSDGRDLWIGTGRNGLFRMSMANGEIVKYKLGTGALENSVNVITGKDNQIWIGTKKGLYNISVRTDSIRFYNINRGGLPHNYINCLFFDRTGKLWVTTRSNILAYIQKGKVYKKHLNSVGGIITLGPVTEDAQSRIWIGSSGSGVFILDSDSIINLTVKEGLLSNYCYSILYDANKGIWVGHKSGLSRIKTSDFLVKTVQHIETATESFQFNPNAAFKDREEKLLFGTDKGLVIFHPMVGHTNSVAPVLSITSLKINDNEMDHTGKIVLSPGRYKIRIDFLGINLSEPELVTYQYKMDGFDNWSEITRNTSVTYNNMTEGKYTFILNASSGDGAITNYPVLLSLIIKKPLWKNWWFYFIFISIIFMLFYFYIKRREYRFIAEKRILEEKVLERTHEIQFQKNEIEIQRDIIDEKNASITASIKYASNIQNAILPPIELINRLFANNFILSRPKDIVSGDFYWLAEIDDKIVFAVADCTGHGVPGAFMSFLGITLLNSLVNIQRITQSDLIVTRLRERVAYSLQQGRIDISTADGMDIALCVLDLKKRKIQFTGGMNNLIYIREGKVEVVKADRFSVCAESDFPGIFTLNELEIKEGDMFYLCTDGFKDQFGGDFDKKYLIPQFYLTLLEIHKLTMSDQKKILEKKLDEWMKGGIQTDDITVLGIRL